MWKREQQEHQHLSLPHLSSSPSPPLRTGCAVVKEHVSRYLHEERRCELFGGAPSQIEVVWLRRQNQQLQYPNLEKYAWEDSDWYFHYWEHDACTLPKALIQGYENNWTNVARDEKSLYEENRVPFESLLPELDKRIREYHAEELANDHATLSGKLNYSGHTRNKRLAYDKLQYQVLPFF